MNISGKKVKNILLSYPRSGCHWLSYCVECITKQPTIGSEHDKKEINRPYGNRLNIGIDKNAPYLLFHIHGVPPSVKNEPLILLLRNYLECIPRHTPGSVTSEQIFANCANRYIGKIQRYRKHEASKMLIYFEDLIRNPRRELIRIVNFLGYTSSNVDEFIKRYKEHQQISLSEYIKYVQPSQTSGKPENLNKQSKKAGKIWSANKIKHMKIKYPQIYEEYLHKFEEDLRD